MQSLKFPAPRGARLGPAVLLAAVVLLFLALVPSAKAANEITANPQSPVVGEQIVFTVRDSLTNARRPTSSRSTGRRSRVRRRGP